MKSIIYVMNFWYLFLILTVFSCSCLESRSPSAELVFPNKELEEIIVRGGYSPGGDKAREWLKRKLIDEELLKTGESVEEAIRDRYQDEIEEYFNYSQMKSCYYKKNDKEPIFNHDLKTRLYNKEGIMLTEDFLRLEKCCRFRDDDPWVVSYLPYHDEGHEIRIVKLEGTTEVVLETLSYISGSELKRFTNPDTPKNRVSKEIVFNVKDQCHDHPGPR